MAIRNQNKLVIPEGLTPHTAEIFKTISTMSCIKDLFLCGGTAQSIQMNHRLSEDLDFELIGIKKDRPSLPYDDIINEIKSTFKDARIDILGDNQLEAFVNNESVKLSFYRPDNPVKYINPGPKFNNIQTPSLQDLLGMKLYTLCVRQKYRDYYDIHCLLSEGYNLTEGISYASHFSRHTVKSKAILSRLLAPQLFPRPKDFDKMKPKYDLTPEQIAEQMQERIENYARMKSGRLKR